MAKDLNDWLKVDPESGAEGSVEVAVTAVEHTGREQRTAVIKANNAYDIEATVKVVQEAKELFLETNDDVETVGIAVPKEGGDAIIYGMSNASTLYIIVPKTDVDEDEDHSIDFQNVAIYAPTGTITPATGSPEDIEGYDFYGFCEATKSDFDDEHYLYTCVVPDDLGATEEYLFRIYYKVVGADDAITAIEYKVYVSTEAKMEHEVTITEAANDPYIEFSEEELVYIAAGETKTITVKANVEWALALDE